MVLNQERTRYYRRIAIRNKIIEYFLILLLILYTVVCYLHFWKPVDQLYFSNIQAEEINLFIKERLDVFVSEAVSGDKNLKFFEVSQANLMPYAQKALREVGMIETCIWVDFNLKISENKDIYIGFQKEYLTLFLSLSDVPDIFNGFDIYTSYNSSFISDNMERFVLNNDKKFTTENIDGEQKELDKNSIIWVWAKISSRKNRQS